MKMRLYSIRDIKTADMCAPFVALSDSEAVHIIRELSQMVEVTINEHPTDFELLFIGEFDSKSGVLCNADLVILPWYCPAPGAAVGVEPPAESPEAEGRSQDSDSIIDDNAERDPENWEPCDQIFTDSDTAPQGAETAATAAKE